MDLGFQDHAAYRWLAYALTFVLAAVLASVLTPRLREAAIRFGIVDRPDGRLKNQREPVPYLGGVAIWLSFLLALAGTFGFSEQVLGLLLEEDALGSDENVGFEFGDAALEVPELDFAAD